MEILRNLWRRKLRNILTISGIAIGIMALTTMGSMAEKNNKLIDGGVKYFSDHIAVSDSTSGFGGGGGGLIDVAKVAKVQAVDGVLAAFATARAPAKSDSGFSFGVPDEVFRASAGEGDHEDLKLSAQTRVPPA